ncbi:LysR family transcriptional regulator [Sporomusa termitida]|uniref:HTH-type transcriptional regulator CatM n=1 Tax=Sporomusa termitida TaxID=2377 RepID=A0A517DWA5_9FIRM|nr:LysR family transcriptional regulator [Sporomusa termitida]QDR81546.1 HTH-type transcriptional regulator CatM [Sporomusa termitida]
MLKNMDYVYAVYENKSFSKAAQQLYISQPALSAAIKKVEEEIQLPLFDRSCNPIQLTPAGEYYIESTEKIMAIEKEMAAHFNSLSNQGTVHVGSASFFCAYILPTIVQDFKVRFPGYSVNLLEANADDLVKCLRSGIVDIILDVEKLDANSFNPRVWAAEQIVLAVPAAYEINRRLANYRLTFADMGRGRYREQTCPQVSLKQFEQEPFLLLEKGNDMYQRGLKMCRQAGFVPKVAMYLDQMLTAYYIACSGKGVTFVRAGVTHYLEPTNKLFFYKTDDENAVRNIMLYCKKSQPLSQIGNDFINFMQEREFAM